MSRVKFNLRGTIVETNIETIQGSEYLVAYLKRWNPGDEIPFIDRSPRLFDHVLCYLSDPEYPYREEYKSELDFYGIKYTYTPPEDDFKPVYVGDRARVQIHRSYGSINTYIYDVKMGDRILLSGGKKVKVTGVIVRNIPITKLVDYCGIKVAEESITLHPSKAPLKSKMYQIFLEEEAEIFSKMNIRCRALQVEPVYCSSEAYIVSRDKENREYLKPIGLVQRDDIVQTCKPGWVSVNSVSSKFFSNESIINMGGEMYISTDDSSSEGKDVLLTRLILSENIPYAIYNINKEVIALVN